MGPRTAAVALVFALAAFAAGRDAPEPPALAEAKALAGKGETLKAASRFGDAIAAAHVAGDMQAEQTAAKALESFYDALPRATSAGKATTDAPPRAAVLAAVLAKLDAKRSGAFVSAASLARNVLYLATETGDFSTSKGAVAVASAAPRKGSGAAAAAVAKYAEGVAAAAAGDVEKATAPLQASLDAALANGWSELAMHVCTELAAAWAALKALDKAESAVVVTSEKLGTDCGVVLAAEWEQALRKRLPGAPEKISSAIDAFVKRVGVAQAGLAGGEAGRGGRGADGGASPLTDIGKLLPRLAKTKPLVSATRKADAIEIRWSTKTDAPTTLKVSSEVRMPDEGGVVLGLEGRAAALLALHMELGYGGLGGRHTLREIRASYLLADGETFAVTKDGLVTISR